MAEYNSALVIMRCGLSCQRWTANDFAGSVHPISHRPGRARHAHARRACPSSARSCCLWLSGLCHLPPAHISLRPCHHSSAGGTGISAWGACPSWVRRYSWEIEGYEKRQSEAADLPRRPTTPGRHPWHRQSSPRRAQHLDPMSLRSVLARAALVTFASGAEDPHCFL